MINLQRKPTAIKGLLLAALLFAGSAWADVAGTVTHLSGPLVAKKPDGTVKVLAVKSEVESGDTLVSEKNTYAQVKFIDNSQITLRPSTTFKIEKFAYNADKPDADKASFDLVKGGLRSVTGALGKRNKEKFELKTPSATIGIRGTTFIAQYVPPVPGAANVLPQGGGAPLAPPTGGAPPNPAGATAQNGPPVLAPGLHLSVTDGAIVVTNSGGSLGFQAGQFGFVPSLTQPPVIVPSNPGLQFTPPPVFNSTSGPAASSGPGQGQAVDCIVR